MSLAAQPLRRLPGCGSSSEGYPASAPGLFTRTTTTAANCAAW
ncbi:hypothetical protein ABZ896_19955 [Streptomyces sp. NPDC047072]